MLIKDAIRWILVSLTSQKQRSFLTSLGIAIGIAAVALLTSLGEGLRVYMVDTFSVFGTRIITITAGKTSTGGMEGLLKTVRPITVYDAEQLHRLPNVDAVSPLAQGTVKVEFENKKRDTELLGVGPEAAKAWRYNVRIGHFLPNDQSDSARPYAVLGSKVYKELFGSKNPLGESVRVGGYTFKVIGVMEEKGQMLGFSLDDVVYVPAVRAMQILNMEGLTQISLVFNANSTSKEMSRRVKKMLIQIHGREDFTLQTQEDILKSMDKILRIITIAIAGLGSISLLVGGVGVATIMTTALRERMPEIGLLRALGATRQQTLLMFLGEAIVLASLGGMAGILLVVVAVLLATAAVPSLPLVLQPVYLLLAWLLSTIVGLIAGITPAWQASLLNPVEALRQN